MWTLTAPPGQLHLSCSTEGRESPKTVVSVVDPGGYWRARTLADLGCPGFAPADWAVGPGRAATAGAAVKNLVEQMRPLVDGLHKAPVTATRADIGYPAGASETWLVLSSGHPHMTVVAATDGHGFVAYPDAFCGTA